MKPNRNAADSNRRSDVVTINMPAAEEQWERQQQARREARLRDPDRLGHWGPIEDDE